MNKVVKIDSNDERHEKMVNLAMNLWKPENLRIVVRGDHNKKDNIEPVKTYYDLYFYVAAVSEGKIIYSSNYTQEDIDTAIKNTENSAVIGDMFEVLDGGSSIYKYTFNGDFMIIVTYKDHNNGSGILLCDNSMKLLHEKIGDFYVLPSSIHEIIIVPDDGMIPVSGLKEMVMEINATQVALEDKLSDKVFRYDGETLEAL